MASNIISSSIEMITEILSRLPSKSLIRFKSVCKNWLALLTTSHFITLHYQLRPKQSVLLTTPCYYPSLGNKSSPWITLMLPPDGTSTCRLGHSIIQVMETCHYPSLAKQVQFSEVSTHLVGSSNGLICFSVKECDFVFYQIVDKDYIIWNPATKQYRYLPASPDVVRLHHQKITTFVSAFGFDQGVNDDYKLLRIAEVSDVNHAEVFSSRSGSWKKVECSLYISSRLTSYDDDDDDGSYTSRYQISCSGVVVKGLWYTVIECEDRFSRSCRDLILTFDMSNDTFSEMGCELPYDYVRNYINILSEVHKNLMVYKDSLAMSVYISRLNNGNVFNEIWTMKNDSTDHVGHGSASWTRLFILESADLNISIFSYVLGVWNDKEIIICSTEYRESRLLLFDPLTQQLKNILEENGDFRFSAAHMYVESLVSIF